MKRGNRYLIFKRSDIRAHLNGVDIAHLIRISQALAEGRKVAGKPELVAVVVESDWPEFEPTWAAIERRVDGGPLEEEQWWLENEEELAIEWAESGRDRELCFCSGKEAEKAYQEYLDAFRRTVGVNA